MKRLVFVFVLLVVSYAGFSQTQNPIDWVVTYNASSSSEGEIVLTAKIEKGWHTYSQRASDAIPVPTSFTFAPSKQYALVGKTEESGAHEEFDKAFEAKLYVFTEKAEFRQKIKLNGKGGFPVNVTLEYITCNDVMCLPPKTLVFNVKVP